LIDSISKNVLRTIRTEGMRLACACWTGKGELSCGSRNGKIYHHDVRMPKSLIRFVFLLIFKLNFSKIICVYLFWNLT